jgi:hypothetical protein
MVAISIPNIPLSISTLLNNHASFGLRVILARVALVTLLLAAIVGLVTARAESVSPTARNLAFSVNLVANHEVIPDFITDLVEDAVQGYVAASGVSLDQAGGRYQRNAINVYLVDGAAPLTSELLRRYNFTMPTIGYGTAPLEENSWGIFIDTQFLKKLVAYNYLFWEEKVSSLRSAAMVRIADKSVLRSWSDPGINQNLMAAQIAPWKISMGGMLTYVIGHEIAKTFDGASAKRLDTETSLDRTPTCESTDSSEDVERANDVAQLIQQVLRSSKGRGLGIELFGLYQQNMLLLAAIHGPKFQSYFNDTLGDKLYLRYIESVDRTSWQSMLASLQDIYQMLRVLDILARFSETDIESMDPSTYALLTQVVEPECERLRLVADG